MIDYDQFLTCVTNDIHKYTSYLSALIYYACFKIVMVLWIQIGPPIIMLLYDFIIFHCFVFVFVWKIPYYYIIQHNIINSLDDTNVNLNKVENNL